MSETAKIGRLWGTYNDSLKHLVNNAGTQKHHHTRAHLSTGNSVRKYIIIVSALCVASISISLLLMRLPVLRQLNIEESAYGIFRRVSYLLVFYSVYLAVAIVAIALKNLFIKRASHTADLLFIIGLNITVLPLTLFYSFQPILLFISAFITLLMLIAGKAVYKHYSYAGVNFYIASIFGVIVGLVWGAEFLLNMPVSTTTRVLILSTTPLLLVGIPSGFLHMLELYDIVCRDYWRRPRHPLPVTSEADEAFVSIQVPTYSEPPDMVIQTLDKLSAIDYKNYEVIVIDNNTKDPSLWKPVLTHCNKLGHKFRFIHADNISGAKGGALNFIHNECDPRTTIIGVIDADYQVDPEFLRTLVGHFKDPKIGFVQTPHDYRSWQNNLFLTMCYWEYKIFFHSAMISLNERDAGITVGTMCLVRKDALEKAGGWSEWCVTEDSELAIRIHDVGYSSIYVDKTYGRGLIPDSFEGYKKQRYRWTAGPVQEFRHHFRHFIGLSKRETKFTFLQRIFHLNHGLANVLLAFNIPLMLIGAATVTSMIIHKEVVAVPFELWIIATVTLLAAPLLTIVMYRVTVKATLRDIVGQAIATRALGHVIFHAALRTALTGNADWNRTSKFKSAQSYVTALIQTKEEIIIGLSLLVFTVSAYLIFPYSGLSLMMLIGISYMAFDYFAAPFMALIGVWSFKHATQHLT